MTNRCMCVPHASWQHEAACLGMVSATAIWQRFSDHPVATVNVLGTIRERNKQTLVRGTLDEHVRGPSNAVTTALFDIKSAMTYSAVVVIRKFRDAEAATVIASPRSPLLASFDP